MNDYQQRKADKAATARKELEPIAKALGWTLLADNPELDYPARYFYMANGQGLEIGATVIWNNVNRFEFSASEWPKHTDKNGNECKIAPHELGQDWKGDKFQAREQVPRTTAARTRGPEAIARQIQNKLIPEYCRVYDLLVEVAESRQGYANKEADTIRRLFEATQEEPREGHKPYFVRNCPGETITVRYRSPGSITIDLSANDMIYVINALREKRSAENAS